jgi:D-alanyl-D-alanine carboxypeptidase (penicillin-binding protein 5/6)
MLLSILLPTAALAVPDNSAGACVLVHADSGQTLYAKNADARMLIASTTKIMTALVVIDHCDPDTSVAIKPEWTGVEGSSMYLKAGENYTIRELLYGLLVVSGNDAATALACICGGSIEGFAKMMNDEAVALGLQNSHFQNPHGLDAEGHYSSAADLAVIACEAMKRPLFAEIVGTGSATIHGQTLVNHNKLLRTYPGALGIKTGYTMAAGRILVSCAERNGLKLVCVTISDPNDWTDHTALLDWGFENYEYKNVLPMGGVCELPVIGGTKQRIALRADVDTRALLKKGAVLSMTIEAPPFVYAGFRQGECAGRVFVKMDGQELAEYPLVYSESVDVEPLHQKDAWQRFRRAWFMVNRYGYVFEYGD